jgi:hypothetical protein
MDRRDLLLLRVRAGRHAELSCERLYMQFVDAQAEERTARLFTDLSRDLENVATVRVVDRAWLSSAELRSELEAALASFRMRGGRVIE